MIELHHLPPVTKAKALALRSHPDELIKFLAHAGFSACVAQARSTLPPEGDKLATCENRHGEDRQSNDEMLMPSEKK